MATVYIIQESVGKNITGAFCYGAPEVLFPPNEQLALSPGPIVFELKKKLQRFCDDDFLLLIGDPAIIGIACAVASEVNRGRFKLLKWDRQEQRYFPVQVSMRPEKE
jgi:hypothetical protein